MEELELILSVIRSPIIKGILNNWTLKLVANGITNVNHESLLQLIRNARPSRARAQTMLEYSADKIIEMAGIQLPSFSHLAKLPAGNKIESIVKMIQEQRIAPPSSDEVRAYTRLGLQFIAEANNMQGKGKHADKYRQFLLEFLIDKFEPETLGQIIHELENDGVYVILKQYDSESVNRAIDNITLALASEEYQKYIDRMNVQEAFWRDKFEGGDVYV